MTKQNYALSIKAENFTRTYSLKVSKEQGKEMDVVNLFVQDTDNDGKVTDKYQGPHFSHQPVNNVEVIFEDSNVDEFIASLAINHDNDLTMKDEDHEIILEALKDKLIIKIVPGEDTDQEGVLPG